MGLAGVVLEIVTPMVDLLLPAFNAIAGAVKLILEGFTALAPVLVPIVALMNAMWLKEKATALMTVISTAWKSLGGLPVVGPALAAAAALAGVGLVNRLAKADDMFSPGDNQAGYGKRTLMAPEGAIALNNKDTVIAGTNLFKKEDDMVSAGAGDIQLPSNNEGKETNALLKTLVTQNAKKPAISPVGLYSVQ